MQLLLWERTHWDTANAHKTRQYSTRFSSTTGLLISGKVIEEIKYSGERVDPNC